MKARRMLLFLLLLVLLLAGCDLSHKHYLDEWGVCRSCGEDLTVRLTPRAEGGYTATAAPTYGSDTVYFRFSARGEEGVSLSLSPEGEARVREVSLYPKGGSRVSLFPTSSNATGFLYEGTLGEGVDYYVAVTLTGGGSVSLTVAP